MESEVLLYSLAAGLATTLGSLIVLFERQPQPRRLASLLGAAAGIMLAVVVYDLLPAAFVYGSGTMAATGMILGLLLLHGLDLGLSRCFAAGDRNGATKYLKIGYLIAFGIALHDLPEGIAIAAGYTAEVKTGLIIILAIGLHNIPEGMATAAPLVLAGMPARRIILLNILVSLFTPLGTILGFGLLRASTGLITVLLALAAGAMTYICTGELIPEMRRLHPGLGWGGLSIGFLLMRAFCRWH
ncbi:MAG: ZIP family metal transporter [bacterium]|jgi:ZIP family zinc transporter